MLRIAHLSDLHLPLAPGLPRQISLLANKRALGFLSWHTKRKHIHKLEILQALLADVKTVAPDQIVITGDLTNISMAEEFTRALDWLRAAGGPESVMVVPGNHDAQVMMPWSQSLGLWEPYLAGDRKTSDTLFPVVRELGSIALIGLSSAVPSGLLRAQGLIGPAQLAALEDRLRGLGEKGAFRVVLLHHPPFPLPGQRRKELVDWAGLQSTFQRAGVELVLHGHIHGFNLDRVETASGPAPVIAAPSASASASHAGKGAGWNLCEIRRDGATWRLDVSRRSLVPGDGLRFTETATFSFALPAVSSAS